MAQTREILLAADAVAKALDITIAAARKRFQRGQIPAVKMGRQWRVKQSVLQVFIDRLTAARPLTIAEANTLDPIEDLSGAHQEKRRHGVSLVHEMTQTAVTVINHGSILWEHPSLFDTPQLDLVEQIDAALRAMEALKSYLVQHMRCDDVDHTSS